MILFLFLITMVVAPIAFFLNNLRMFARDMWTLMDLHRIWYTRGSERTKRLREVPSNKS